VSIKWNKSNFVCTCTSISLAICSILYVLIEFWVLPPIFLHSFHLLYWTLFIPMKMNKIIVLNNNMLKNISFILFSYIFFFADNIYIVSNNTKWTWFTMSPWYGLYRFHERKLLLIRWYLWMFTIFCTV
jgi:hypothetical protein